MPNKKKSRQKQDRWTEPGRRLMDIAYMRDGELLHTGEALVLALLLHTKGKSKRAQQEVEHVAKMLNDPNLPKTRR